MREIQWRRILLHSAGWIVIAFAFSGLLYFSTIQTYPERPPELKNIFFWQVIIYAWAIISPLIILFAKRFRFERGNWAKILPAHLLAAFVFLLLHTALYVLTHQLVEPALLAADDSFFQTTWRLFVRNWVLDIMTYCFILSTIYGMDFYRQFQAEQLKSSELKAALANSQLQALKMQLHPHFLFNTLNSISALMHDDLRSADRMVARLGDFLRLTLDNSGENEVSFKQEMDFVNCYLEIESVRFQDRLTVTREIEPETLAARVPNLILQPIIENAIRHGVSRRTGAGRLAIRARRGDDKLQIEIEDNGPGWRTHNENGHGGGIGLANTRARLAHLYGASYLFEIKDAAPHGLLVALEIPFKTTAAGQLERETI